MANILKKVMSSTISQDILYALKTIKILISKRDYLPYHKLILREKPHQYDHLFKNASKYFKSVISPFKSEFKWSLGRIYNGQFESIDVECYYAMIRKFSPNLLIEIGSGHSTWFALEAMKKNKRGTIICIDPEPRRNLPQKITHIQSKVEDVDPKIFDKLQKNDILSIDSSHTKEEATYHIKKILPRLALGVIIHHHDISYPYKAYYEEDEVIMKFYGHKQKSFEVLTGMAYLRHHNIDLIRKLIHSFSRQEKRFGGSLWTIKKVKINKLKNVNFNIG